MNVAKTKKREILKQLLAKLSRMTIPVLYRTLVEIDDERKSVVLNLLSKEKFKALVAFEYETKGWTSLWNRNTLIRRTHLDMLSASEFVFLANQSNSGTNWGTWKQGENPQKSTCSTAREYLEHCGQKRLAELLEGVIRTTNAVKSAAETGSEADIFICKHERQYPFEAIRFISCVHPAVLFPALNQIEMKWFDQLLWLAGVMAESDPITAIFINEYSQGKHRVHISEEIIKAIAEHMHVLEDRRVSALLVLFDENDQRTIFTALGKDRILQMRTHGYLSSNISLPESMGLFNDADSNEWNLSQIASGRKTTRSLSPRKTLEMIGEYAS